MTAVCKQEFFDGFLRRVGQTYEVKPGQERFFELPKQEKPAKPEVKPEK
jgi:hypothetical protein